MQIKCNQCGKSVSSEVPKDTVIRAYIICPECIANQNEEVIVDSKSGGFDICPICGRYSLNENGWCYNGCFRKKEK